MPQQYAHKAQIGLQLWTVRKAIEQDFEGTLRKVAVGKGTLDFLGIVEAAGNATEWLVVEFDEWATDMMEAVQESYRYLTQKRLALGKV